MKPIFVALLAISSVLAKFEEEDGVLVLDVDNFDDALQTFDRLLVDLYAPWCGHCERLAPEFAAAAQRLAADNVAVRLAKVDADAAQNQPLHQKFVTKGFPTLKYFERGVAVADYDGRRDRDAIAEWLRRRVAGAQPLPQLESAAEVAAFRRDAPLALLAHYVSARDVAQFERWARDAAVPAALVRDAGVALQALHLKSAGVVLSKRDDDELLAYEPHRARFPDWFAANRHPLVAEFSQAAASTIFAATPPDFVVLFYRAADEGARRDFKTAARRFKGTVQFVQVDVMVERNDRICDFFGVAPADVPTVRALSRDGAAPQKFRPATRRLAADDVAKFAEDFKARRLSAYRKSEAAEAAAADAAPVATLVGENFAAVARDAARHVLVAFHAPWCPHCRRLEPVWRRLGQLYGAQREQLLVARMDATLNEVEGVTVRALPTVSLFPRGAGAPTVDFTGDLNLRQLVDFVVKETGLQPDGEVVEPEAEADAEAAADAEAQQEAGVQKEAELHQKKGDDVEANADGEAEDGEAQEADDINVEVNLGDVEEEIEETHDEL